MRRLEREKNPAKESPPMLLVWTENLTVGVEEFDQEHKKLIAMVNELHGAIEAGNSKETLGIVLDQLEDYARHHCLREELLFIKTGYPDAPAHMKEHDELRQMLAGMRERHESGLGARLSVEVMDFIYGWLTNHICCTDRKYTEHMHANGIF
jgi:hemerythrin-like metal-binding protein